MSDKGKNDPAEKLKGYDPKQRAEILETESVNIEGNDMIRDLTPDRGQSITNPVAPEEQLHDSEDRDVTADADTASLGDIESDAPEGGPDAQAADEKLKKGDIDIGMDKDNDLSVLGVNKQDLGSREKGKS